MCKMTMRIETALIDTKIATPCLVLDREQIAKSYRNFDKIFQNIQKERIKAFKKYQADVSFKKFPLKKHSVLADQKELTKFKKLIKDYNNGNK